MSEFQTQVEAAMKTVSGFDHLSANDYRFERLSGLTNLVFRVDTDSGSYVLRIPGKGPRNISTAGSKFTMRGWQQRPVFRLRSSMPIPNPGSCFRALSTAA